MIDQITGFLSAALANPRGHWEYSVLSKVAARTLPDGLLGERAPILQADAKVIWARWFVESMCDPRRFLGPKQGISHVMAVLYRYVVEAFPAVPEDEKRQLVSLMAALVDKEIRRLQERGRRAWGREERFALWAMAGPEKRCWICGYRFEEWAIERFLEQARKDAELPRFVDFTKRQGLREQELRIEVDHVLPLAKGGEEEENLRLACGWCNRHKSARLTLFDVSGEPITVVHPTLGRMAVPRQFWIVRILALRGRCEWTGGCGSTSENSHLTIAPWRRDGALNPINLRVTCLEHDPVGVDRLVDRMVVARWERQERSEA